MSSKVLRAFAVVAVAAAGVAFAVAPAAGGVTDAAFVHAHNASTSTNWSGYALAGTYTAVTGHWTVPTVSGSGNHYSSQWVGIDGFANANLLQTGTAAYVENGKATYHAWWEILPAAETALPLTIHGGDAMTATLTKSRTSTAWRITLTDDTTGEAFRGALDYAGPDASVEWIEETPTVNGAAGPPPRFSTFSFTAATVNGANPGLTANDKITLVQNGITYSTPSDPSGGNAFSVSYTGP